MQRRTKLLLLIGLLILILIIIFAIRRAPRDSTIEPDTTSVTTTVPPPVPPRIPPAPVPAVIEPAPDGPVAQNPRVVASDFVERFGSYSSQGYYQNLRDLFKQMTPPMRARTEALIAAGGFDASTYEGMTTRALNAQLVSDTDTTKIFTVETQRIEISGPYPNGRTFNQTATVSLVKDDLRWQVASLTWEE